MRSKPLIFIILLLAIVGGAYWGFSGNSEKKPEAVAQEEGHGEAGHAEGEAAPDSTEIPKDVAEANGVTLETAAPGNVAQAVTLTGRITLNQNTTAQVKARFAGIVRSVKKGQGETVKAGEVLATVESNDSLQVYPVKSPIDGIILARDTNIGDVAGDAPLFTVADVSNVWAEFHVFPRDIDKIRNGQTVRVTSFEGHHTSESTITVVSPVAESSSQTIIARVTLPNTEGLWHSGMTVRGDVLVAQKQVPLAVKSSALQRMEGKAVVFVQSGDRYVMRPVKIGLADSEWTEIREGLQPGEIYVSSNSFLIKADIGKAGAEHED